MAETDASPQASPAAGEGGKRRQCGRVIGYLSSRVLEDHRQYFEEREGGMVKCLPSTWQAQKQGSREEVLIMLDKKGKIYSHLGLKVRESIRQKDHEMQLGKAAGPV